MERRTPSSRTRKSGQVTDRSGAPANTPLICFSNLRWGLVWQRPQHILTRMVQLHPVYYVEEPMIEDVVQAPELRVNQDHGVTILTPILPLDYHECDGFCDGNNFAIQSVLADYFAAELDGANVITWYYTPMAYGALPDTLSECVTVYDVMDELAARPNAPVELRDLERALMQASDLVFASGPSLHEPRKYRHPRAFCMPSGVDEMHFRYVDGARPEELASLQSPIIGFSGIIDERLDMELIAGIADARPDWSIVMIGPVEGVDDADLVQRDNIHYLGKRSYQELPRLHACFDAAILPFTPTEATQAILPARTLELLAGGIPVVTTPIRDVVDLHGDVVEVARTPEEFVTAIERLWSETPVERSFRKHLVTSLLAEHNWDLLTARMEHLVNDVLLGRPTFAMVLQESLGQRLPAISTLPISEIPEVAKTFPVPPATTTTRPAI